MNIRQRNTVAAMKRSHAFATHDPLPLPLQAEAVEVARQADRLHRAITLVDSQVNTQGSGYSQQQTEQRHALRQVLLNGHLRPIRAIALVLGRNNPGLPKLISLKNVTTEQGILTAANTAVQDLVPYRGLFVDNGLQGDFLEQMATVATELQDKINEQGGAEGTKVSGAVGITSAIPIGRDAMACLGAVIRRLCAHDPTLGSMTWRAWRKVSHIVRTSTNTGPVIVPPINVEQGNTGTVIDTPVAAHVEDAVASAAQPADGQISGVAHTLTEPVSTTSTEAQ